MNCVKRCGVRLLSIFLLVGMILPKNVWAGSSFSVSGGSNFTVGSSFTQDFVVTSDNGLNSTQAEIAIENSSCAQILSVTSLQGDSVQIADVAGNAGSKKIVYFTMGSVSGSKSLVRINLKAGTTPCTTKINVTKITAGFTDKNLSIKDASTSKTITIGEAAPVVKSNDATLKVLKPNTGTISPTFSANTLKYTMSVEAGVNSITFTATPNNAKASVTSGKTCTLQADKDTNCNIVVKAEDGTQKTYTVTVSKKPVVVEPPKKSSDATLKSLSVSGYTLTPKFSSNTTTYAMTVKDTVDSLNVDAIANDPKATVEVSGNTNWVEGINIIKIKVTAEDETVKTYIVNVTKKGKETTPTVTPKSTDNYLKGLTVQNAELSPKFDKNINSYNLTVSGDVTKLDLTVIKNNSKAKYKIVGNEDLKVGQNTVTVEVTAEDGSLRVYTLNVNKIDKSSDNKLASLDVGYPLSPEFDKDTFDYDVNIPYGVDQLEIIAKPHSDKAKVQIIGNEDLKEGKNTILIKVTDENGFTQYYTLNVTKEAEFTFLGLTKGQWLLLGGAILGTGVIVSSLFWLFRKKKPPVLPVIGGKETAQSATPIIEFKPEFNFGSKNGTDDDVVHEGGVLNQYFSKPEEKVVEAPKENTRVIDYQETQLIEEAPYDLYDDEVTKDELYDAIQESIETKDVRKLKMLYEQERLNREKERLRMLDDNK